MGSFPDQASVAAHRRTRRVCLPCCWASASVDRGACEFFLRVLRRSRVPGSYGMAMTAKTEDQAGTQSEAPEKDSPLLDLSDAAVKRFIKTAKARGFVTLDALIAVLPSEEVSPDQIEDTMSMLSDMGITVVESEDPEEAAASPDGEDAGEDDEPSRAVVVSSASVPAAVQARAEPAERTDDPVRMYLRDMGSVELLSREGEIAIAKRIEAGREAMIAGLCESPLTFQAVIIWRDELRDAKILLRDIIDLEATQGAGAPTADGSVAPDPTVPANGGGNGAAEAMPLDGGDDGDGDDEGDGPGISLSALEDKLKPEVLAN